MIKPGDMVMLVWACCAEARQNIGWTGTVDSTWNGTSYCGWCVHEIDGKHVEAMIDDRNCPIPLPWLIKLDPPAVTTEKRETMEVS